jgi:hypothetical protein
MNEQEIRIGLQEFNIPEGTFPLVAICLGVKNVGDVRVIYSKKLMESYNLDKEQVKIVFDSIPGMLIDIGTQMKRKD